MSIRKSMLLAALTAMGMSSPAFATTAPTDLRDLLPVNLGKKKIKPHNKRGTNFYIPYGQPAVKREHKDRHKKGRP